jgi:hypothetical protein
MGRRSEEDKGERESGRNGKGTVGQVKVQGRDEGGKGEGGEHGKRVGGRGRQQDTRGGRQRGAR